MIIPPINNTNDMIALVMGPFCEILSVLLALKVTGVTEQEPLLQQFAIISYFAIQLSKIE